MKFTNVTTDTLRVVGAVVKPGEQTPDLTDEQATGFVYQGEKWEPDNAKAAQALIDADEAKYAEPVDEPEVPAPAPKPAPPAPVQPPASTDGDPS